MDQPKNDPPPVDLKNLVQQLNASQNNIKTRRARIDAIIDQDFADLGDVFKKLA